jgi:N-acetylglucosamine kinase-like BadF-type ATPase
MSGGPDDKREILAELIAADRLEVVSDAEVALAGATGGAPGVVVIAGTGSMALARDAEGRTARAGGWGYLFGDEGGAFDIVRQALRAILRAEEGWGPPTTLRENLLTAGSAAGANELMHLFYTAAWPRERIAALALLVEDAAEAGDEVARRILADAGGALAGLARSVRGQLFSVQDAVPVAPAGGVFESRAVRQSFEADLGAENVIKPCYPADVGALLCAYRAAGVEIPALEG